jgi:hypothetical protein
MKKCSTCKKYKELNCFCKNKFKNDGIHDECKICHNRRKSIKRANDLEYKERKNKLGKETYKRNKTKILAKCLDRKTLKKQERSAQSKTEYLIKMGKIKKESCIVCNSVIDIQAHHEDYNNPLDIMWLCRRHHAQLHVSKKENYKGYNNV